MKGEFQSDLRMTYCASVIAHVTGAMFENVTARDMIRRCRVGFGVMFIADA